MFCLGTVRLAPTDPIVVPPLCLKGRVGDSQEHVTLEIDFVSTASYKWPVSWLLVMFCLFSRNNFFFIGISQWGCRSVRVWG